MINELIDIKFSYNGNLGVLQQKTIDNKAFCGRLLQNKIISREEWRKVMQDIQDYFVKEIQNVLECSAHYTDIL